MKSLEVVPLTLAEANAFVARHHRHHGVVRGHKFSLGVDHDGSIVGVAIVGRPVSRVLDNGWTLEVTRVCTDGTKNAASMLYGACRRATFALGYRRLVTYILQRESGVSLRAAGWRVVGESRGGSWSRHSRPRVDTHPMEAKLRYEATE
ncbi:MAG TPA: XF1762 family protein [Vicinamibacterales bacterium]|nr:XF1762 family protein [Vicinamibacterales bacterium]